MSNKTLVGGTGCQHMAVLVPFHLLIHAFTNIIYVYVINTRGKKVSSRYVGALVADVHNVLINGGIYGYPATRDTPQGKLRLLYESAPMAMIMEQAGGAGSTGYGRILDVLPPQPRKKEGGTGGGYDEEDAGKGIHVRVPTFLGSVENVFELDQFHKYYGEDE